MKLEVIKSYTLAILVGISLIFSFSLWSYEPNDEFLEEENLVDDIDLGGTTETKKSLIQPSMIIFNKWDTNHFGFINPNDRYELYEEMQTWVLYNFRTTEANGRPNDDLQVELIFPESLPMEIIPNIFTINNDNEFNDLPENMLFSRIYVTFKANNTLTFSFLSNDGKTQVRADVNNTQKHDLLKSYMDLEGLVEYIVLEESEYPIYVPGGETEITGYRIGIKEINPDIMRNALFVDPAEVFVNQSEDNELWYQDGTRNMQVFDNRISLEYIFPQEINEPLGIMNLLDESIAKINSFKGWIHDFHLEEINSYQNSIRYQMYYNGIPVFNNDNLASIEQLWRNNGRINELSEHKGPLYEKNDGYVNYTHLLESGRNVIDYLKNNTPYELDNIQDVQIGYRLSYQDTSTGKIITLTPSWFVKVSGEWEQIIIDDELLHSKGVS